MGRELIVDAGDRLDLGMVRSHAAPHQAVGSRQAVEHVDLERNAFLLKALHHVEARRPRTDHRDAERSLRRATIAHVSIRLIDTKKNRSPTGVVRRRRGARIAPSYCSEARASTYPRGPLLASLRRKLPAGVRRGSQTGDTADYRIGPVV